MERMTMPNFFDPNEPIVMTLAIIKPEAMCCRDEIFQKLLQSNFQVIQSRIIKLTAEQASEFYKFEVDNPCYSFMVLSLSDGPIQAICLSKQKSIAQLNALVGPNLAKRAHKEWPGSLRSCFGSFTNEIQNGIHASKNKQQAEHEIHFFFPNSNVEIIKYICITFILCTYYCCSYIRTIDTLLRFNSIIFKFTNLSNFNGGHIKHNDRSSSRSCSLPGQMVT